MWCVVFLLGCASMLTPVQVMAIAAVQLAALHFAFPLSTQLTWWETVVTTPISVEAVIAAAQAMSAEYVGADVEP
jgi:hypothetical protein